MTRSNYIDELDQWSLICWRGAVTSAIKGKRGQALLKEMLLVLDSMEHKSLIKGKLEDNGKYCALGIVGKQKGIALVS